MNVVLPTLLALVAFAANSVLCRIALGHQLIDPAAFTIIRLLSGSMALYAIFLFQQYFFILKSTRNRENVKNSKGSWSGSICLFVYAISFSYAYVSLETGAGALILFGAVQLFMITYSLLSGTRLSKIEWTGLASASIGIVYLMYPNIGTPSFMGSVLMMLSGLAWAGYTIIGKKSKAPFVDTCYNFFRTIPLVIGLAIITLSTAEYSEQGMWLAVVSGAAMSGVGYAIWYFALSGLTPTQAGVVQLFVPVIAAIGGIVFMQESMTLRLGISIVVITGGIAMVLLGNKVVKLGAK